LHSQLSEAPSETAPQAMPNTNAPPPPMSAEDNPFIQAIKARAEQQALDPNAATHTAPPPYEPKRIADEEIPPGHRRVRTPFGDVLVKEEQQ
jgi:hypothetical protein